MFSSNVKWDMIGTQTSLRFLAGRKKRSRVYSGRCTVNREPLNRKPASQQHSSASLPECRLQIVVSCPRARRAGGTTGKRNKLFRQPRQIPSSSERKVMILTPQRHWSPWELHGSLLSEPTTIGSYLAPHLCASLFCFLVSHPRVEIKNTSALRSERDTADMECILPRDCLGTL